MSPPFTSTAGRRNWCSDGMADDDRSPLVGPALHRSADHRLVAKVETVEIAERDDRSAKLVWDRLVVEQSLHRRLP